MKRVAYILIVLLSVTATAVTVVQVPPPIGGGRLNVTPAQGDSSARWRVQPTAPMEVKDLDSVATDLRTPENIRQEAVYNDSLNL